MRRSRGRWDSQVCLSAVGDRKPAPASRQSGTLHRCCPKPRIRSPSGELRRPRAGASVIQIEVGAEQVVNADAEAMTHDAPPPGVRDRAGPAGELRPVEAGDQNVHRALVTLCSLIWTLLSRKQDRKALVVLHTSLAGPAQINVGSHTTVLLPFILFIIKRQGSSSYISLHHLGCRINVWTWLEERLPAILALMVSKIWMYFVPNLNLKMTMILDRRISLQLTYSGPIHLNHWTWVYHR